MFSPIRLEIASNRISVAWRAYRHSRYMHTRIAQAHMRHMRHVHVGLRYVYPHPYSALRSLSRRIHASRRYALKRYGRIARFTLERTYTYVQVHCYPERWLIKLLESKAQAQKS